ncbi:hypothetical protein [Amycolatopsis sp. cmx-4-54]|uniref:hypothetical protein n=1 Tax=Amycolatopsis sp. cmx-4-54 TaxID=2790936 RepID=UPI00397964D0
MTLVPTVDLSTWHDGDRTRLAHAVDEALKRVGFLVLVGYTTVDCASYDRATEIAAQLAATPHPEGSDLGRDWYVDIRPCADSFEELEL